ISHSSRLDDVNGTKDSDENWALLDNLHDQFKSLNLEGLEIMPLVDKNISAGNDWEKHLNLWLNECHVAIILFTDRALNESDWVKKEATILLNRYENESDFLLIPVFFQGETKPENLSTDSWKAVDVLKANPLRECPKDAADIIEKTIQAEKFKHLTDKLRNTDIPTPFQHIAKDIQQYLVNPDVEAALKLAYDDLDHPDKPPANDLDQNFAQKLTRFLLISPSDCTDKLDKLAAESTNPILIAPLRQLYSAVRGLWIDTGGEYCFSTGPIKKHLLAVNGDHLNEPSKLHQNETNERKKYFTLDCYIKRKWQKDKKGIFVPEEFGISADKLEESILKQIGYDDPDDKEFAVKTVKAKEFIIVYLKTESEDVSNLDTDQIVDYQELFQKYSNLVLLVHCSVPYDQFQSGGGIELIDPPTNTKIEQLELNRVKNLHHTLNS
ncbi:MAG: TIR domain-containing protein, partial [Desulfuromusa sp.]|nr:TIR domain-containing protein [Desulfuromusa sp.]